MRILNISAQKPFDTGSGVYLSEVAKGFDQRGHTQALLCGLSNLEELNRVQTELGFLERVEACIFNTESLDFEIPGMSDEMPYPSTKYRDMDRNRLFAFKKAFEEKLRALILEFKPDLIISHHLYILTALVAKVVKETPTIKVVGVCHGTCLRQLLSHDLDNRETISQLKALDSIFALHKEQLEEIKGLLFGTVEKKTFVETPRFKVIGTGYNPLVFNRQRLSCCDKGACNCSNEIKVIYAGKLSYKKGIVSLIKAMALIGDNILGEDSLVLKLAGGQGSSEDMKLIQREINNSPYKIELLGKLTQRELAVEFNRSDIFVLPSFYEGLPLVVIEAMACNLPVVVSKTSGLKEWILEKAPKARVQFVELPRMKEVDQPLDTELVYFEEDLAKAISVYIEELQAVEAFANPCLNEIDNFSWLGVCDSILVDYF